MGKRNTGMMDWFKGSNVLNLVTMGKHMKQDENGNDIEHYHCSLCGDGIEFSSSSELDAHMSSHDVSTDDQGYSSEEVNDWADAYKVEIPKEPIMVSEPSPMTEEDQSRYDEYYQSPADIQENSLGSSEQNYEEYIAPVAEEMDVNSGKYPSSDDGYSLIHEDGETRYELDAPRYYDAKGSTVVVGDTVDYLGKSYTISGFEKDGDVVLEGDNGFRTKMNPRLLNDDSSGFNCSLCNNSFDTQESLDKHMTDVHPAPKVYSKPNIVNFSAQPASVAKDDPFTISWDVAGDSNVGYVVIKGGPADIIGSKQESASMTGIDSDREYVLEVYASDDTLLQTEGENRLFVSVDESKNIWRAGDPFFDDADFSVNGSTSSSPTTAVIGQSPYVISISGIRLYDNVSYELQTPVSVIAVTGNISDSFAPSIAGTEEWILRARASLNGIVLGTKESSRKVNVQQVPKYIDSFKINGSDSPAPVNKGTPYLVSWDIRNALNNPSLSIELKGPAPQSGIGLTGAASYTSSTVGEEEWTLEITDTSLGRVVDSEPRKVTIVDSTSFASSIVEFKVDPSQSKVDEKYKVIWDISAAMDVKKILLDSSDGKSLNLWGRLKDEEEVKMSDNSTVTWLLRLLDDSSHEIRRRDAVVTRIDSPIPPTPPSSSLITNFSADAGRVERGKPYKVHWVIASNPNISRAFIECSNPANMRSLPADLNASGKLNSHVDAVMGDNNESWTLRVIHIDGTQDEKNVSVMRISVAGVDNDPSNVIRVFSTDGDRKKYNQSFLVKWAVIDPLHAGRYSSGRTVDLIVDGIEKRDVGLRDQLSYKMANHEMIFVLQVKDRGSIHPVAVRTLTVSLGDDSSVSSSGRSVKERLIAGESEKKLRDSGVSSYAIDNAKAEIEAERRTLNINQHSADTIKAETALEEMRKKHGAGGFLQSIIRDQMKNVSAENVAHSQYVRSGEAAAREKSRGEIDKNTAEIIKSDNSLKALLAKEDTVRMKNEMDAAKVAGKSGVGGSGAGKMRNPITDSEGLSSFVGSLTESGRRQDEMGVEPRNPLNMDMGGIMPRRLGEEEVDNTLDRYKKSSFAWAGMESLGTAVPQGEQGSNQTIGAVGMTGLTFGGIPGMTSPSSGILNPSSLNATMNKPAVASSTFNMSQQQTRPSFTSVSRDIPSMQTNVDPLKGKSVEDLKSLGLQKQYVDQTTGYRMPADSNTKVFVSEAGAKYYYVKIDEKRRVGRPSSNTFVADAGKIDSIIKKGIGQTSVSSSPQTPINDFAFGQEDIYGKMERENAVLNNEYGKAMPEFDLEDDKFSAGVNIIDPSKVRSSGSVNVADMLSGIL